MPFSRSRRPCCISQSKGIKLIVITSSIFGATILLLCLPGFVQEISSAAIKIGNANGADVIEISPITFSWYSVGRKITAFAILQILSSFCLLNSKRFNPIAKIWIAYQIFAVVGTLVILWNLPLPTTTATQGLNLNSSSPETKPPVFFKYLFAVLRVNVCLTIFLILVLMEFIIHPEKQKHNNEVTDGNVAVFIQDCEIY